MGDIGLPFVINGKIIVPKLTNFPRGSSIQTLEPGKKKQKNNTNIIQSLIKLAKGTMIKLDSFSEETVASFYGTIRARLYEPVEEVKNTEDKYKNISSDS